VASAWEIAGGAEGAGLTVAGALGRAGTFGGGETVWAVGGLVVGPLVALGPTTLPQAPSKREVTTTAAARPKD
jgi:hypothetical protein